MKQKLLAVMALVLGFTFQSYKEFPTSTKVLTCYDSFAIGHTYLSVNCNNCSYQFCNEYFDVNTCIKQ